MKTTLIALAAACATAAPAMAALPVGAPAPEFAGKAYLNGEAAPYSLDKALKKGPVVLYFFPGAFTGGCNVEAHEFAAAIDDYKAQGATVIGLTSYYGSKDRAAGPHDDGLDAAVRDFSKQHCNGKFPVAAATADTVTAYDVPMIKMAGVTNRTSFVITPDHKIIAVYSALDPSKHVEITLNALKAWRASHPR